MSCLAVSLATKGVVCCPQPIIRKIVHPLSLNIIKQRTKLSMNILDGLVISLKTPDVNKLNVRLARPKISLLKKDSIKISLKKCED